MFHGPGETLYLPHHLAHAVYNVDDSVAVGDNPFFLSAIEQSAIYKNLVTLDKESCRDPSCPHMYNKPGERKTMDLFFEKLTSFNNSKYQNETKRYFAITKQIMGKDWWNVWLLFIVYSKIIMIKNNK